MSQAVSSRVKVVPKSKMLAHPLDWPRSTETVLKSCYCVLQGSKLAMPMPCARCCATLSTGLYP